VRDRPVFCNGRPGHLVDRRHCLCGIRSGNGNVDADEGAVALNEPVLISGLIVIEANHVIRIEGLRADDLAKVLIKALEACKDVDEPTRTRVLRGHERFF